MIQQILTSPNEKLRQKSIDVSFVQMKSVETRILIADLKETMRQENGVGIAASQIGVLKRVIVVDTPTGSQAFFNPKIVKHSFFKRKDEEGCLSVPGVFGIVKRYKFVVIEAFDENSNKITINAVNFLSTVFQHEIDHLNGILFIDKIM